MHTGTFRGGEVGGGALGAIFPGPPVYGAPKFAKTKKIISNFLDSTNGMRKKFLNQHFTFIDKKNGFDPCCNSSLAGKFFFEP